MPIVLNKSAGKPAGTTSTPSQATLVILIAGAVAAVLLIGLIYYFTLGKNDTSVSAEKLKERDQAIKALQAIPLPGQAGNNGAPTQGITPSSH